MPTTLSDYTLRAPLRADEVSTTIVVPTGKTAMRFHATELVYARKGTVNAEPPGAQPSPDNSGGASFPYPGGVGYEVAVAGGERYTFVTEGLAGWLFVAFV